MRLSHFWLVFAGAGEYACPMSTRNILPLLASLLLVSCVGQKQFTIRTTPVDGATVHINGQLIEGTTPVTTEIREDKDLGIVVEKEGYQVGSATVHTKTSWWRALLWTENDPLARYIEEDEVTIPLQRIETVSSYTPTVLPAFNPPPRAIQAAPSLSPLPAGLR